MKVAIIEVNGQDSKSLQEKLEKEVANIEIAWKKAPDYFDALALVKKNETADVIALVAARDKEDDEWDAFMIALAVFESTTGKTIMKAFYPEPEDAGEEIERLHKSILKALS